MSRRSDTYLIKESFDNLPMGITLFNSDEIVVFANYKMKQIYHRLFKKDYHTYAEFNYIFEKEFDNAVVKNNTVFFDDSAYEIIIKEVYDNYNRKFFKVLAMDTTVLNERKEELEKINENLIDYNKRLLDLKNNLQEIIREEETLNLKIKVHDETGKSIIEAKNIYNNPSIEKIQEFASRAKSSFDYLNYVNIETDLQGLIKYAQTLNITLNTCDLPQEILNFKALKYIISEAITNTHKHGQGTQIDVSYTIEPDKYIISISNNGKLPDGPVEPSGGLLHLNNRIKKENAELSISTDDKFTILVAIKKGN